LLNRNTGDGSLSKSVSSGTTASTSAIRSGRTGKRLARSLREFDLVQPLVWNQRTGHVVGGHQRLEILKAQGVAEVDVVVVDLPLSKEKALNIALNNQRVGGGWDAGKLIDVMQELQQSTDIDTTLTGFDANELRDLLLTPEESLPADPAETPDTDLIRVQFEVSPDDWDAVRADLDPVLAEHGIRVHVRDVK